MTQSAKDYLKAEIAKKLDEAKSITETAEAAARSVTAEERQKAETLLSEVASLKARVQDMEDNEKLRAAIDQMNGPINVPAEAAPEGVKSVGDAFTKSDAFRALSKSRMSGNWTTGPVNVPMIGSKATVSTTASPVIQPDFQTGIFEKLAYRLTVADLIASGTTDSGTVRYVEETTATNAAAATAEEGLKPESTLIYAQVDEAVRKIATFLPVSDEMLEDVQQFRSFLDQRLTLFVRQAEETQILTGSGTAPELRGILNRTGIQTQAKGTDSNHDAIFKAITKCRTVGFTEPDGVVIHPDNWQTLRLAQDANGQYFGGGPFMGPYGQGGLSIDSIWGLPVVVTSRITTGTALVGSFRTQAQVFRRDGLTVEASNSHSDFFQRNLTAIRAETRLALAVYRPASFCSVTGLT